MASTQEFIDFALEQCDPALEVRARKMFGEYGLYAGGVFFGVVCDDQFFVKPTDEGRAFIGVPVEAPPSPGANDSFLIEDLEDGEWLSELIRVTVSALPPPRKRKR